MKIIRKIELTKEERQVLERVISWYSENWSDLEEFGIDIDADLYHIIEDVLEYDSKGE